MTRSIGRRAGALVGLMVAGMAVVALAGPASAQAAGPYRFQADCPPTTTRTAVHFLTGPNAGVLIGTVTCTATTSAASALVPTATPIAVTCPANTPQQVAQGLATQGAVSVGSPAGARCQTLGGDVAAASDGFYFVNPYPLAVGTAAASAGAPDLATPASTDGGSGTNLLLLAGVGVLALAVVAQVTISRRMRHQGDAAG